MATYAIGDLQGCYQALQRLLAHIRYDSRRDFLWFTGDLVNRGPASLECLRFVKEQVESGRARTVLGNHDLHLLAVAAGIHSLKPSDTLHPLLDAPDLNALCHWLRQQPVFLYDESSGFCLVHAGIAPQWHLKQALSCAYELESILTSSYYLDFLSQMYGNEPALWRDDLRGMDRLRFISNCFTRIRYCDHEGRLELQYKGPLSTQPENLMPWFKVPWRYQKDLKIIFGHWAALYPNWDQLDEPHIYPLDSGCVWGNALTAFRLDDQKKFSVACLRNEID